MSDLAQQNAALTAEIARLKAEVADIREEKSALSGLYMELIMEVGNKHDGETRHETARRYIRQAEATPNEASRAALDAERGQG